MKNAKKIDKNKNKNKNNIKKENKFKFNKINQNVEEKKYKILNKKMPFAITEAYKTFRTNVIFSTRAAGCKKYVITSAIPGEGKSTSAVNLAVSFAETGKKVILIDADLRRPSTHNFFDLKNGVGLSNMLSGVFEDGNENIINKTKIANLDFVSAGHIPPNPIELLSSENMEDFVKSLEDKYDVVIIDTPPIDIVSDALVMSKYVTGYIFVTRSNYSDFQSIVEAKSKFDLVGVKPLGVLLNDYVEERKNLYTKQNYKYKSYGYSYTR